MVKFTRPSQAPLTPYATLLASPHWDDDKIRARFHVITRTNHPDRPGALGQPGPLWYAASAAYSLIKTEALRITWLKHKALFAGLCPLCQGSGVIGGSGVGGSKPKICAKCGGEGRPK